MLPGMLATKKRCEICFLELKQGTKKKRAKEKYSNKNLYQKTRKLVEDKTPVRSTQALMKNGKLQLFCTFALWWLI